VWISRTIGEANAAKAELRALEAQKDQAEADKRKLMNDLANAPDPATQKALQQKVDELNKHINDIKLQEGQKKPGGGGGGGAAAKPNTPTPRPACTCQSGDPLCSCL